MEDIGQRIQKSLWKDHDDDAEFPSKTPLLAHYTSIETFDRIIEGEELWFANPLNMNDSDELLFGIERGISEFRKNKDLIKACGSKEVFASLLEKLDRHVNDFDKAHLLDTYIACFSLHDKDDYDGSLSMWRGYGSNGGGISFVIDTEKIEPNEDSPIILAPVDYVTYEERIDWIRARIRDLAELLDSLDKTERVLDAVAWHWVERLKVFSLYTKHKGFEEEKEWRFVYLKDRDTDEAYLPMFGYNISDKGVEPKLKLKLKNIPVSNKPFTLESIIDRIILGPTASSELSMRSVVRMLSVKGKHALKKRVRASSIPYRP
ncbi:hypothetical protein HMF8227_00319 [Saliniradius amylolyticus]|uniref:DUF2971 domain-containing protein n=1 Tax=Saliniradius amylolyticus TaxID=2183582 RepID=A0A2S2DZI6_9ALTE|nr:DUF2971 domain-containing protein [Saliniradius amylolyticus]AWL10825.1 hypothetical protein HMF8227_00319 [Saliniradius amylolyticus]